MATDPRENPTKERADGSANGTPEDRAAPERDAAPAPVPVPRRTRGYPPRPKR